jgi:adenylate cyclase
MKYRTKLYLSLLAIAAVSILLALFIFSTESEKLIFRMLRSRSISIAATTATHLDPKLVEKAIAAKNMQDPAYVQIRNYLQKTVDANRRQDIFLSDIYLLYPDPKNPGLLLYGVDAAVDPEMPASPYLDSDKDYILKHQATYFSDPGFVADQFGVWYSGFAPIISAQGKLIAILAVDIDAADIHLRLVELIKYAFWGLSASLLLAIIIGYFHSKRVTTDLQHLCNVVKDIEQGDLNSTAKIATKDEFGELAGRINAMSRGLRERERLKTSFARYVSAHVLDKILQSETPLKLEGERKKVTLLFSDIREFTQLAEKLPPEEVVNLLNQFFEVMIEVIFSHSGTLDKFIGDGIMAEFGAPLDDEEQETHAIEAALQMQKELQKLCDKWERENKPRIQMGIGIHTGEAVLGNIGSERRTEYTAIGDSVNVASRLEQATKMLKTPILVSETTYLGAKDNFSFKDLGSMALPGRKEEIKVYSIDV